MNNLRHAARRTLIAALGLTLGLSTTALAGGAMTPTESGYWVGQSCMDEQHDNPWRSYDECTRQKCHAMWPNGGSTTTPSYDQCVNTASVGNSPD